MLVKAGVSDGRRVFDLACGQGYCAIRASEKGAEAIGIDLSENMIELAKKLAPNADFKVGDAEELPFGDGEFDVVLINFGMLHFPNPEKVLAEVFRVLKPNGKLAFTA
jgi:ubiquinone/menaquinone biosynthesis C-methylase UbiE